MGTAANRQGIAAARFRHLQHFGAWQEPTLAGLNFPSLSDWRASLAQYGEREQRAAALVLALRREIPAALLVARRLARAAAGVHVRRRSRIRAGQILVKAKREYFGDPSPGRVTVRTSQFFGSDARAITWDRLRVDEWE